MDWKPNRENRWCLGRLTALLAVQACLCFVAFADLAAQTPRRGPAAVSNEQILVLKNGEILAGQIEQDRAKLIVHTRQGSRIVIPKNKAEFICDSISEAFWGKSARTRASDTRAQVDLFRWCLKHRQLDLAESQLEILMQCDVSAAQMVSLNRQLSAMLESQARQAVPNLANREDAQSRQTATVPEPTKRLTIQSARLFQPLPKLGQPEPKNAVAVRRQNENGPTISADGKVIQASFIAPQNSNQSIRKRNASSTMLRPIAASFSTAGSIPDLSTAQKLPAKVSRESDPYDAAIFNAETDRLNSLSHNQ
jgi:hypothetical protein